MPDDASGQPQPADWQPGSSLATLQRRAALLTDLRAFFARRGVMEVDTPLLADTTVTEPNIHSLPAGDGWLQTSPEYFMKRLLAAGAGPIYQVCRAFRDGEQGHLHNREFLMLEWYRPGYDDQALMEEVEQLLGQWLPGFPARRMSWDQLLDDCLQLDVRQATDDELAAALARHWRGRGRHDDPAQVAAQERDGLLDLAYADAISELDHATFIVDFPPALAALARLRRAASGRLVAARFELIVGGVELANGFYELTDADEQRQRFSDDNRRRQARGLPQHAPDERLLAALAQGLPDCSGVSVGLDRVLMLALGLASVQAAMAFSGDRC